MAEQNDNSQGPALSRRHPETTGCNSVAPECALFFPPLGFQFNYPELGLPRIIGFLKSHGISVLGRDLNRDFIDHFLPGQRAAATRCISDRLRDRDDRSLRSWDPEAFIRFETGPYFNHPSDHISGPAMRDFADLLVPGGGCHDIRLLAGQLLQKNPLFDAFYAGYIRPLIGGVRLAGFSVLNEQQLASALYIARLLKADDPGMIIVLGGPWCNATRESLMDFGALFDFVDLVCTGEGELPLLEIIRRLRKGAKCGFGDIRGLALRRGKRVVLTGPGPISDLNKLPMPDFSGFSVGPLSSLPVLTTQGCYWGRCRFCFHILAGVRARSRDAAAVVREMEAMSQQWNVRKFEFADASTPWPLLLDIAARLAGKAGGFEWDCLVRADVSPGQADFALMRAGGCRSIAVGLESADPAVLCGIDKGIRLEHLDQLLNSAQVAGIRVRIFIMNFPGQSRQQYLRTWEWLQQRRELIAGVIVTGDFGLARNMRGFREKNCPAVRQPAANRWDTRSFNLPHTRPDGMDQREFYTLTSERFSAFHRRKDNYAVVSRVYDRSRRHYLLIRPPTLEVFTLHNHQSLGQTYNEPVGLLRWATFLKNHGHTVELIDAMESCLDTSSEHVHRHASARCGNVSSGNISKVLYRRGLSRKEFLLRLALVKRPDEIFITSQFTYEADFVNEAVAVCRLRFPGVPVVIGGIFATLCPDAMRVPGAEVFMGLSQRVDCCKTDLSLLSYRPSSATIKFSRGCPNNCSYCAVSRIEGKIMRYRDLDEVMAEISEKHRQWGIREFIFWESNAFGAGDGYLEQFLNRLARSGLRVEISFPEGLQPNLISDKVARLLYAARTARITLAFESADKKFARNYSRPAGSQNLSDAVTRLRRAGACLPYGMETPATSTRAFILLGLPGQTCGDVVRSVIEVWKSGITVCFTAFTPIPGTAVFAGETEAIRNRPLRELHPLLWPCAHSGLTVAQLEEFFTADGTSSFFQCPDNPARRNYRRALQAYICTLDIATVNAEIRSLRRLPKQLPFRVLEYAVRRREMNTAVRRQILLHLLLLRKARTVFYISRPLPPCLRAHIDSWYDYYMPRGCADCLRVQCRRRRSSVPVSDRCPDCPTPQAVCMDSCYA